MHRAIISATEWENMLALRAHPDAQYEFQALAYLILDAINESVPTQLQPGEWHLPFGDLLDYERITDLAMTGGVATFDRIEEIARMITVARCARVSYRLFKGKDEYKADISRFEDLRNSGHWSPFEHVAQAMTVEELEQYSQTYPDRVECGWLGNFRGFKQYRRMFPHSFENRHEPRLKVIRL